MKKNLVCFVVLVLRIVSQSCNAQGESLPPLENSLAPQTFEALWAGYDPRVEPLETEILKEWEEGNVVFQIVRYRIGIFKGQRAMMAAVYGYPKGGRDLPGLVQIHGGGQYADYRAVLTNAKRGYATLSIAWAGRISAPQYMVNREGVQCFWDGKTNDPKYRLTTDWGALDAYHAPCRHPKNAFAHVTPASWTLDDIESPRNNPWFLVTLGARRALTFLEQQSEVNANALGVYGHSMGGKLTVLTTAADARVKAAAPSCGGLSNRGTGNALYDATIADDVNLKQIACPILFLSPANDFHGRINDLQKALREITSKQWRMTCSPHHNHQDTAHYEVASQLWFDQHLKGRFTFPATPRMKVALKTKGGIPTVMVTPDQSRPILAVDVYYTRQGQMDGQRDDRENTINRFWHYAETTRQGGQWSASLPLSNTDKPLWVYANVTYPLEEPTAYAGYYYRVGSSKAFNLSSLMFMATADQLQAAGVQAKPKPSRMIETFEGDWEKQWFSYRPEDMQRKTHKLYDPQWAAPAGAKLALEVLSEKANKLVLGLDAYAAEIQLKGSSNWQQVVLLPDDFKNAEGKTLSDWQGIMELRLGDRETLRGKDRNQSVNLGAKWQGKKAVFRSLKWVTE